MLLEHHAIYPARVFGEGRLLMDETLAGGGLLGVDVCGGVKLWPYHKYRVVELVPPAAITQTRDVVAHSQKDSATETTIPARLVYEFPTLPPTPTAPSAFREGEIKRGKRARDSTSEAVGNETDPGQPGLPRLPSFFDEDQRARSKKARAHNIKEVLKGVNASVIGEAKLRYRRKKNIAKYNC
ncbi:unnamed protein product [Phytomonas sp. EM1]|nr:unnamed protein product [Phytomonas sp. EM1]|eukprot:CCW64860.1 unnamed protein product [Phytomonas sp. isolate EM1]